MRGQETLEKLAQWLVKYRIPIILAVGLIAAFCAYYYRKIPRDPSVEAMVLETDPDLKTYNHFKEIFGTDEFVLFVVKVPDIFDSQVMKDVEAFRIQTEELPYIKESLSYTNIRTVRGSDDMILVEKLVEEIPQSEGAMAALRKRAMAEKEWVGNFYSPDGTTLAVVARLKQMKPGAESTKSRSELSQAARALIASEPHVKYDWYVAGVPMLKSDLVNTQKSENKKFEILIFSILGIMLLIIFRTFSGVFVTLATVQASIFMLMASHYFSGIPLTMVSSILAPLMMIYGVSSSVHIQTHYVLRCQQMSDKRKALIAAVAVTMIPCMFNSTTTAVGFGSNMVSAIKPIREFAMFASGGIILSLILSFLLIPALLSFFPKPGKSAARANEKGLRVHVLEAIVRATENHKKLILAATFILLLIAGYGISQIRVETKLLEYFRPDSPIRSSYNFIDENLSGVSSMEIMIDTGKKNGMKDPAVIAKMDELISSMRAEETDLSTINSLIDFYKRINMALNGDDPAFRVIPKTRQEAAQFLLLYKMSGPESDLYDFASRDLRYGRITMRIRTLSSSHLQGLVARVKDRTAKAFAPLSDRSVTASVTGSAVLYANMNASLVVGQLKSFGLSLLLVSIMMVLVAGEIGLGLVSLLPNLMPIAMTMGLMGYMGYALDSTTAMVAPIALGMAVDSTIHFMVRFRREYLDSKDYNVAAAGTIRLIGRAMIGTSLPLAAGFMVLTTSEFLPVFVFGLLSSIVVLLAMVFDLMLTPIFMVLYRPKYRKAGLVDFFD